MVASIISSLTEIAVPPWEEGDDDFQPAAFRRRQKSCGQLLGESWPRAIRSGTGRGGDVTGSRVLLFRCRYGRALAVETAGRASPSATQTFGSLCDCRLTKRYPVSVQATTFSFWLSKMNSPFSLLTVSTAWPSPILSRTTVISSASRGHPASISILRFNST